MPVPQGQITTSQIFTTPEVKEEPVIPEEPTEIEQREEIREEELCVQTARWLVSLTHEASMIKLKRCTDTVKETALAITRLVQGGS